MECFPVFFQPGQCFQFFEYLPAPSGFPIQQAVGNFRIFDDACDEIFCRGGGMEGQEVLGEKEAVVVARAFSSDMVDDVLVDENTVSPGDFHGFFQCLQGDFAIRHADELQVLVPVHDLKARISRDGIVVDDIEHQIGKTGITVQVGGMDVWGFHDDSDDFSIKSGNFQIFFRYMW